MASTMPATAPYAPNGKLWLLPSFPTKCGEAIKLAASLSGRNLRSDRSSLFPSAVQYPSTERDGCCGWVCIRREHDRKCNPNSRKPHIQVKAKRLTLEALKLERPSPEYVREHIRRARGLLKMALECFTLAPECYVKR